MNDCRLSLARSLALSLSVIRPRQRIGLLDLAGAEDLPTRDVLHESDVGSEAPERRGEQPRVDRRVVEDELEGPRVDDGAGRPSVTCASFFWLFALTARSEHLQPSGRKPVRRSCSRQTDG